jgi:hypothetical protein
MRSVSPDVRYNKAWHFGCGIDKLSRTIRAPRPPCCRALGDGYCAPVSLVHTSFSVLRLFAFEELASAVTLRFAVVSTRLVLVCLPRAECRQEDARALWAAADCKMSPIGLRLRAKAIE